MEKSIVGAITDYNPLHKPSRCVLHEDYKEGIRWKQGGSPACIMYRLSDKFREYQRIKGGIVTPYKKEIFRKNMLEAQKKSCSGEHLKKRNAARAWWLYSTENKFMLDSVRPVDIKPSPQALESLEERGRLFNEISALGEEVGVELTDTRFLPIEELVKKKAFLLSLKNKLGK